MTVDDKSQAFLRTLIQHGGRADTTTIRAETGLNRNEVHHRYRKLSNYDWIEIDHAETGKGERAPPKVAVLTEEGRQAIRRGDAGGDVLTAKPKDDKTIEITKEEFQEFHREITGVKNQLNTIVEQLNQGEWMVEAKSDEYDELQERVEVLEDTIDSVNQSTYPTSSFSSETTQPQDEAIQELKDTQEYLDERVEQLEAYLNALELFLDSKGIDLQQEMGQDMYA